MSIKHKKKEGRTAVSTSRVPVLLYNTNVVIESAGQGDRTHLAVSFPNLDMITSPVTTPFPFSSLPGAGVISSAGPAVGTFAIGYGRICMSFSTPPSPKNSPVHGSMYAREGGWRKAIVARRNCQDARVVSGPMAYSYGLEMETYKGDDDGEKGARKPGDHGAVQTPDYRQGPQIQIRGHMHARHKTLSETAPYVRSGTTRSILELQYVRHFKNYLCYLLKMKRNL